MSASPSSVLDRPERMYSLRELTAMGLGSRPTLRARIDDGVLPAVKVGNAWKIRERDLVRLTPPVPASVPADLDESDAAYLEALAARLVSTWPRLSDERKGELGRLLALA